MRNTNIVMMLGVLLMITSCIPGQSNGNSGSAWNTGTDGITLSFVQNNPPEWIRNDKMDVAVEYHNKGTYPTNVLFYLHGYDPNIVFGQTAMTHTSGKLEAKTEYNPEGSQSYFAEWGSGINSPAGTGAYPQLLSVTACYPYKTIAEPSICISPESYDTSQGAKCTQGISNLGSSQGAPLAVTAVKVDSDDDKIYLEITVNNKGRGSPYTGSLDGCYSLALNDKDTFRAKVSMSSGTFTCEPQATYGKIRLDSSGKAVFFCEMENSITSYTVTPLKIELEYNYAESIQKQVMIER